MTTAAALHWPLPTYAPQRLIDFWKFDQFQCVLSQLGVLCWAAPAYLVLALWSHMYYKYFYSQLKATISSFCKQNLKSGYHLSFPLKDWGKFSQCQQVNIFIFISPWAESPMVSWRKDTFLCNTAANPCHSTACCSFKLIFMKHFYAAPSESFQCSILHWQTFHRDI